jgi:hypothetical protein
VPLVREDFHLDEVVKEVMKVMGNVIADWKEDFRKERNGRSC